MSGVLRVVRASARLEFQHMARSRVFILCTVLAALNFLALVSLFGVTGSYAPTAIVDLDAGAYGGRFEQALASAHHSFRLHPLRAAGAAQQLRDGKVVAIITIPPDFTARIDAAQTVPLLVQVDNLNIDLTDDVERALPSAIVAFGQALGLPDVHVRLDERDSLRQDTGYIPYLAVSGLALDALVLAGVLGAMVVAREWEGGTVKVWKVWRVSPASAGALLAGKLLAAASLAGVALALTTCAVVLGYRVVPENPLALAGALATCVAIFTCLGACLGALVRRTQPIVPLVFGLAMPFYLNSGALEPARFDGELLWKLAHLSPVYYAVGILEAAFHQLQVTPESAGLDLLILAGWAVLGVVVARLALPRKAMR